MSASVSKAAPSSASASSGQSTTENLKSSGSSATSAGVPTRDFEAKPGDTVWGHVERSLGDAGKLKGLSTDEKNRRIQNAVNEVKVLDKNGKEIPDKNLIYAGAKYKLVFPGGVDTKPPAPAPKRASADGFRASGSQATKTSSAPGTTGAASAGGVAPSGKAGDIAASIAMEAAQWNYQLQTALQSGTSFAEAHANAENFERTKTGTCTDIAFLATRLFEAKGIDARVVGGRIKSDHPAAYLRGGTSNGDGTLNHAWVEYKGDDGKWHRFDPTAAALHKNPQAALDAATSSQYGDLIEIMDNKGTVWTPTFANQTIRA